jgi:hypothetical protein
MLFTQKEDRWMMAFGPQKLIDSCVSALSEICCQYSFSFLSLFFHSHFYLILLLLFLAMYVLAVGGVW